MQYKIHITILYVASLILSASCFLFDNIFLLENAWVFFLVHYSFIIYSSKVIRNKVKFIFSPSFIAISYLYINYIIGCYSLANGLINDIYLVKFDQYYGIQGMKYIISYNIICTLFIFVSYNYKFDKISNKIIPNRVSKISIKKIIFGILCLIPFTIYEFKLNIIGGAGDFSVIPRTIVILYLIFNISKSESKFRYLLYGVILIYMMLINFDSKREVLYLLMPILFFEYLRKGKVDKFNFKKIILYGSYIVIVCYSLLAMTIMRGFGNYDYKNTFEAFALVPELTKDFDVLSLMLKVSEAPTTTYHSFKAMNYVILEPDRTTYGMTYLKALYIPFPRNIFPGKPESMTTIFTSLENKSFDMIGGSFPINFISESFWNFNYAGIIIVFISVYILNTFYDKMYYQVISKNYINVSIVFLSFIWTYMLGYFRGYGLDQFSVFIFVGLLFSLFIVGLNKLTLKK